MFVTLLVPFDGSPLSVAALSRAVQFADTFQRPVLAVAVIPQNANYAREHGWIDAGEPFDRDAIIATLREQVAEHAPEAELRAERVDRNARAGSIARVLRRIARQEDATMLFVGSDNAGRLVTTLTSVGGNVAADQAYDVVIVRHANTRADAASSREIAEGE